MLFCPHSLQWCQTPVMAGPNCHTCVHSKYCEACRPVTGHMPVEKTQTVSIVSYWLCYRTCMPSHSEEGAVETWMLHVTEAGMRLPIIADTTQDRAHRHNATATRLCPTPVHQSLDSMHSCRIVPWPDVVHIPAAPPLNAHVVAVPRPVHVGAGHCPEEPVLPPKGPPRVPHNPASSEAHLSDTRTACPWAVFNMSVISITSLIMCSPDAASAHPCLSDRTAYNVVPVLTARHVNSKGRSGEVGGTNL